ncbi:glycosyltransferase family 4 protein [Rasiella sp. SM2506]|uniref:glycosyltransferase family 4 protein n=1 Tax=Rasiella sp. SM2506 TaxID=3423914 RepID=UPI003D78ED95
MRIGLVIPQTPGYSETFFNSKIKGLQDNGIEVHVYCQSKKDNFTLCPVVEGPKVTHNLFLQAWYFLKEFLMLLPYIPVVLRYFKLERNEGVGISQIAKNTYLNAHLLKAKLDWLHFGFATQALGSETVAKAIGAKLAVSLRGFDVNVYPIKNPGCYTKLWPHIDKVHSISQYLLNKAMDMGLPVETPFAIITPAVQLHSLPKPAATSTTAHLKITTIARLTWIKGLDVAIAAMKILKDTGVQCTYTIIGDGDKNYRERYKFMVYEMGLEDVVIFQGKLSHEETLTYLNTTDIYVQPSLNEGFCNAVLEAQALGKLTLASRVGGLPENIIDTKTGWLFESSSPEFLVKKIEIILGLSETDKNNISKTAIQRVRDEFNIENQQAKFVSFYSEELIIKNQNN